MFMLEKIKSCIDEAHSFALFWHENIDWDALWSILGFWSLLEKQWKKVSYFTPNEPSHVFNFLDALDKVKTEFDYWDYDVIVFLDFNQYSRIPAFTQWHEEYFDAHKKIIIDHHKPEEEPINILGLIYSYAVFRSWFILYTSFSKSFNALTLSGWPLNTYSSPTTDFRSSSLLSYHKWNIVDHNIWTRSL